MLPVRKYLLAFTTCVGAEGQTNSSIPGRILPRQKAVTLFKLFICREHLSYHPLFSAHRETSLAASHLQFVPMKNSTICLYCNHLNAAALLIQQNDILYNNLNCRTTYFSYVKFQMPCPLL